MTTTRPHATPYGPLRTLGFVSKPVRWPSEAVEKAGFLHGDGLAAPSYNATGSFLRRSLIVFLCLAFHCSICSAAVPKLPRATPETVGMDSARLGQIDRLVAEGLESRQMPGCVVAIGRRGRLVWLKAYGHKQLEPERVRMTTDTVFDMASLTKPIATATSVMILAEQGKIRPGDPVAKYLPEFGSNGKQSITVFQLLTHQGGLIPDNSLADYADGIEKAWQRILAMKLHTEPGTKFVYTDMGFIVLAKLVDRVSGQNIDEFSRDHIFRPLGMTETGYLPDISLRRRAAPTQQRGGQWIQGEVHDPRAHRLGGIAGHAGLFSTATDLAVYAQTMLGRGEYGGARILRPGTVAQMARAYPVSSGLRGLGWDKRTGYSSSRGVSFSAKAFGHGGFTGTVLWIDPELELFVIFLSNRLHPDGKGAVNRLAGRIGTVAADAITDIEPPSVLTGIDVLRRDGFRPLAGRRVGLITNQTGIGRDSLSTLRLLHEAPNVHLVALFSPEHGIEGKLDIPRIGDTRDGTSGLTIHSLYGETRKPTAEMLGDLDTLVFDIQDIGTRFYTYISTMGHAMRAAAEHKIRFVVLDRPNPIGGLVVAGPMLDADRESFVAFHRLPIRHGMTIGELARMFKAELQLDLDLQVIRMEGWRRGELFDATGLPWVNPSPNMRNLTQALLYPGVGLLETTNLSVGRGTDTPFEVIGAPWLDGRRLAHDLNRAELPGVRFVPIRFTPSSSKFQGQRCGGVNILIVHRDTFRPIHTGLHIACRLRLLYPDTWDARAYDRLLADRPTLDALLQGKPAGEIELLWQDDLDKFRTRRSRFLLYE